MTEEETINEDYEAFHEILLLRCLACRSHPRQQALLARAGTRMCRNCFIDIDIYDPKASGFHIPEAQGKEEEETQEHGNCPRSNDEK